MIELATKRLFQVTNVLSGAFQPSVSPDGRRLVFTGFTTDGFDLWTMPFDPASFWPAKPFANARPDAPASLDSEADLILREVAAGNAGTPLQEQGAA